MDWSFIFATVSLLLVIFVIFYLQKYLTSPIVENLKEPLPEFSYDIKFDPFPSLVNLENKYVCRGDDLRKCDMDNPLSCIGCQSLIANCVHFKEDTIYQDTNNTKFTIPKNDNPNEGYCLTILEIEKYCNVYHGDLTLVQLTPDSSDTMLICNCKNPGLIGNVSLSGSCTTAFMCNGQIDNIDQPIDKINCICGANNHNVKLNGISHCVPKTIDEAGDQISKLIVPTSNVSTQYSKNFDKMITQNFPMEKLRDPCSECPITGKPIPNHAMIFSPLGKACTLSYDNSGTGMYFGIPIRRSTTERLLEGDRGPDAILGIYWYNLMIYSYMEEFTQRFVFSFNYTNNAAIYTALDLNPSKNYAIAVDDLLLGNNFPLPPVSFNPSAVCTMAWPTYSCLWSVTDKKLLETADAVHVIEPPPQTTLNKYAMWKNPDLTGAFIWGRETWEDMSKLNTWLQWKTLPVPHLGINKEYFVNNYAPDIKFVALSITYLLNTGYFINFLTTGDQEQWKELRSKMIIQE